MPNTPEQEQYMDYIHEIVSNAKEAYQHPASVTNRNTLPDNGIYPLTEWFSIPDVICVYADIRNSTGLSATRYASSTASIYQFFVDTGIRIFHGMEAGYIDIKWDWFFALFNKWRHFRALAAAISFKTFCDGMFVPVVTGKYPGLDIGVHLGIDQENVLVKQVWLKDHDGRDRRKNEVWAGKPINMAAKLASKSEDKSLLISDRFHDKIKDLELAVKSCGCENGEFTGNKADLWVEVDFSEETIFDFDKAWRLESHWCRNHGKIFCWELLLKDQNINS